MAILMKQTIGGRRAYPITMAEGQELARQGKARLCVGYEIFDEITEAEIEQGYMTRNMEPLPAMRKSRAKPQGEARVKISDVEEAPEQEGE